MKGQGLTEGHLTVKTIRAPGKGGYNNVWEKMTTDHLHISEAVSLNLPF